MTMKCGRLENVEHFEGNVENFYTAKLVRSKKTFNITYDCNKRNLIIHEWYNLTKDELEIVTKELSDYFNNIEKVA